MSELDAAIKARDRAERKAAAANRENEALRAEVRKLRHANFILRGNYNALPDAGYKVRYEKAAEAIRIAREVLIADVTGIPEAAPTTLEPWLGPDWARRS